MSKSVSNADFTCVRIAEPAGADAPTDGDDDDDCAACGAVLGGTKDSE